MGDGDCGETIKTGATYLLSAIDSKQLAAAGSVVAVLRELQDIVESRMGGTLGGIMGIFFTALTTALERNAAVAQTDGVNFLWAKALSSALESLNRYTPAKIGDRTVMDTLISFADGMKSGSFDDGVTAAVRAAEATKTMVPKLGRATYVAAGGSGSKDLPPDPGAWGAMVALKGLKAGM
jgi:dihydroxyacetone kinase